MITKTTYFVKYWFPDVGIDESSADEEEFMFYSNIDEIVQYIASGRQHDTMEPFEGEIALRYKTNENEEYSSVKVFDVFHEITVDYHVKEKRQ